MSVAVIKVLASFFTSFFLRVFFRLHITSQNSNFVIFVSLKVKAKLLAEPKLKQIVI